MRHPDQNEISAWAFWFSTAWRRPSDSSGS